MRLEDVHLAQTYVNKNNKLSFIIDLLRPGFRLPIKGGSCLLVQVIFSIAAVSKLPEKDIAKEVIAFLGTDYLSKTGMTMQQIFNIFTDHVFTIGGNQYKFKLRLDHYKSVNETIAHIEQGQPVVMMVQSQMGILSTITKEGEMKISSLDPPVRKVMADSLFHSLLLMGYDKELDKDHGADEGYLIGRDTDYKYGRQGYFKMNVKKLKSRVEIAQFFGVVVQQVQKLPKK